MRSSLSVSPGCCTIYTGQLGSCMRNWTVEIERRTVAGTRTLAFNVDGEAAR